ncbi:MAG: OmpA family protein [Cellvibrionales bacterium]|nr:OmpA family protein [Cellvibrionales bacterium]
MQRVFGAVRTEEEDHWLTVSDLMAGLMVVFLFIAITYIMQARKEAQFSEEVKAWRKNHDKIYEALNQEFSEDLDEWDAEIEESTLIIRFKNPNVLFRQNETNLSNHFKKILADFCPRYLDVLIDFRKSIQEVRIEGHTSSEWNAAVDSDTAYFKNMELSQGRTRTVLQYCLNLDFTEQPWLKQWAHTTMTANGLSSSRLIKNQAGREDKIKSRRVEFRVQAQTIIEILDALEN